MRLRKFNAFVHDLRRQEVQFMRPKFRDDYRSLAFAFLLFPLPPLVAMLVPRAAPFVLPVALYSAYCAGVLSHNQNHCRVFSSRALNGVYSGWLSVFYGFPIFAWIPTHNQNHHRHLNGEGDAARTVWVRDSASGAAMYSLRAGFWQSPFIARYLAALWRRRPLALVAPAVQMGMVLLGHAAALGVFLRLTEPALAVIAYLSSMGVPALLGPPLLQLTNYLQHVGCDAASPDNHSRNFVSPWFNWFVFDNGYHTVHHENPGTHWSRYRELHAARSSKIDRALNQWTPFAFVARRYFGLGRARPAVVP
jgi:beta-carotene hydroxylase